MRIAFLCKRSYMSKDVILDRYARLYEIPFQLARLGHEVRGYCLNYGMAEEGEWEHAAAPGTLRWESRTVRTPAALFYPRRLLQRLRDFRPDIVIGASDIPHVALGAHLAKRLHVPFAADLYDNYEGFGQARIPGFVTLLRRAVRGADMVTTTSQPLADYVKLEYKARGEVIAMPSTVDKTIFHPRDKQACRRALGLPLDAKLIGTAGGLYADKGVATLYAAWKMLAAQRPDVHLVLAGPTDPRLPPPAGNRLHALGLLPHTQVAELFTALDVGVIYLRDTVFGRYCFPQKAYEMFACELPVAAARVGVMTGLLSTVPDALYGPDNAADLAHSVIALLDNPMRPDIAIEDWTQIVSSMEQKLRTLITPSRQHA